MAAPTKGRANAITDYKYMSAGPWNSSWPTARAFIANGSRTSTDLYDDAVVTPFDGGTPVTTTVKMGTIVPIMNRGVSGPINGVVYLW